MVILEGLASRKTVEERIASRRVENMNPTRASHDRQVPVSGYIYFYQVHYIRKLLQFVELFEFSVHRILLANAVSHKVRKDEL
jgi:hypothetical protein